MEGGGLLKLVHALEAALFLLEIKKEISVYLFFFPFNPILNFLFPSWNFKTNNVKRIMYCTKKHKTSFFFFFFIYIFKENLFLLWKMFLSLISLGKFVQRKLPISSRMKIRRAHTKD